MAGGGRHVVPAVLADELARAGVRHACVTPGRRSTPLALALAAQPGLRVWSHVDERSAGFFALGLAKATRTPVVVACTSGTAAANLLPAVVEAYWARVPLVVLTADRPPELRDCGAGQTIDQPRLFGTHVRWFVEVDVPDGGDAPLPWARTLAARAVTTAAGPPPGPVHLNLPLREPLEPQPFAAGGSLAGAGRSGGAPWVRGGRGAGMPPPALLDDVARRLARARRPLVVVGPFDEADPDVSRAVARLASVLDAPLVAEPAANLNALAPIVAHDILARSRAFRASCAPDAIVRIGRPPTSKAFATWLGELGGVPQVVLDAAGEWPDPAAAASEVLAGALVPMMDALTAEAGGHAREPGWLDHWRQAGRAARAALAAAVDAEPAPFEAHVAGALAATLPRDACLYVGNSLAIRALDWFWDGAAGPARVLANRGANGIDGFVSSVLGAAAGSDARVVGWCGDLALYHDLNGLLAARRHGLRAVLVVVDNGGGGIFDHLPATPDAGLHEALFVTPHGLDFAPIVTGYGADFARARATSEIVSAIRAALACARATVLVVPVDRAASLAAHRRAFAAGVAAVEALA
jgi:2-succinyl-5-enolpyruvyl-6-hydroxy-3-cyclohexene-1-carboxylate synthase